MTTSATPTQSSGTEHTADCPEPVMGWTHTGIPHLWLATCIHCGAESLRAFPEAPHHTGGTPGEGSPPR